MKKANLKTFTDMKSVKSRTTDSGKIIIIQADGDLLRNIILAAQSRKIDLKELIKHPLGPLPWSLENQMAP